MPAGSSTLAVPSAASLAVRLHSPMENVTEPATVPPSAAVTVAVTVEPSWTAATEDSVGSTVVGFSVVHRCMFSATAAGTLTNAPWRVGVGMPSSYT